MPALNVKSMTPKQRLIYWIKERHSIWEKKEAGLPKPWTRDPILQSYRFCNVYRELDTVTKWIAENWRDDKRWRGTPHQWFAMAVARSINLPETLRTIGYPIPWSPGEVLAILNRLRSSGVKVWTSAYMISTHGSTLNKPEYVIGTVLNGLWEDREKLSPKRGQTLQSFAESLTNYHGVSGFIAGQITADVKYLQPLRDASDWWSWAISGPGSRRGLNRILGRDKDNPWKESEWLKELGKLHECVKKECSKLPPIHAQDLQNCLCEFDKYDRVLFCEGAPKQRYQGV